MEAAAGDGGGDRRRRLDVLECGMTVLPFFVGQNTICNLTWSVTGERTALASILKSFHTPFNDRTIAPQKTKRHPGGCE
jgi:hypothetical protein